MITKCPYCEYTKPDKPLSQSIVALVMETVKNHEDYPLYMNWLIKDQNDMSAYNGVKVHIGRMHKGFYNSPMHILNERERNLLNVHSMV